MKRIRILGVLALTLFMGVQLQAQEKQNNYIFQNSNGGGVDFSGFGSPLINLTTINGELGVMLGGGGAVSINQRFFIGAYSESLRSNHEFALQRYMPNTGNVDYNDVKVGFTHTGIWTGYFLHPEKKIHFGLSSKFGWGALYLKSKQFKDNVGGDFAHNRVFVALPQVEVNFSFTNWLKLNLGVGYQFVSGVNDTYQVEENGRLINRKAMNSSDYQGLQGNISFLFGFFD